MRTEELVDRIWNRHSRRIARNRRAVVLSTGAVSLIAIGAAGFWPRPALAYQDVAKATLKFNSIQWTQKDEGTIRDLGSPNPKIVPAFRHLQRFYARLDPADLQIRHGSPGVWKGMEVRMIPVKPIPNGRSDSVQLKVQSFHFKIGPSKNLTAKDVRSFAGDFTFTSEFLMKEGTKGTETTFDGRPAIRFSSVEKGTHIISEDEIFADPKSKRLVFRKFTVSRPSGERLFTRVISDIIYNGPPPK